MVGRFRRRVSRTRHGTYALRLPGPLLVGAEVADIKSYRQLAERALAGENIYHRRVLFPYTPLTLPLPAAR